MNIPHARKFPVKFCLGIEASGFYIDKKETRVTIESALTVLGYGELLQSELIEALQQLGYQCQEEVVSVVDTVSGLTFETISLSDFKGLIFYAARKGKGQANAFVESFVYASLEDWFRDCFIEQIKSN